MCSCSVLTDDVTAYSYALLGGIIYYHGSLVSSQTDHILSNLSHHIQHGSERLRVSGSCLVFIDSCPTRVSDGACRISTEDTTLSCRDSSQSTNSSLPEVTTVTEVVTLNDRQSLSLLGIIIISVLGGLVFVLLLVAILALNYRHRRVSPTEKARCHRTSSTKVILHHEDCSTVSGSQSQVSFSRASSSSR